MPLPQHLMASKQHQAQRHAHSRTTPGIALLCALLTCPLVSACGQMGPLYQPPVPPEAEAPAAPAEEETTDNGASS